MPVRLADHPAFAGHHVVHVARSDLAGLSNGRLHARAVEKYPLFITSDRHFHQRPELGPTDTMGLVFMRVTPNVLEHLGPALARLVEAAPLEKLIGRRVVVWRDRHEVLRPDGAAPP